MTKNSRIFVQQYLLKTSNDVPRNSDFMQRQVMDHFYRCVMSLFMSVNVIKYK